MAQSGTWVAVYGGTNYDRGRGIAQTTDKGFIVCGPTSSYGLGNTDFYLLKTDSAGKFKWQRTFGGMNIENCFSVHQTKDSGFAINGYTNSFGNGGYDAYLVKTDPSGNLQWQKTYGGTDWDFSYWSEQTRDSGYILAGETYSFGNNSQAYLIKTNSNGDTLWTKTFGGTGNDGFKEVHQLADSGYIAAGYTQTAAGDTDFYLVRTDYLGNKKWARTFGGTGSDPCNSVAVCADGGFLLGGSYGFNGSTKRFFLKTDSAGGLIFTQIDTPSVGNTYVTRIRETMEKDVILLQNADVGGLGGEEIYLIKYNVAGAWYPCVSTFGGTDDEEGYDLVQTADSGFALVGFTATYGTGPDNIFIARTNKACSYNNTVNAYVAVKEVEQNMELTVYPNPFSENLTIVPDDSWRGEFALSICDETGREVYTEKRANAGAAAIHLMIPNGKLEPGFYFLSIQYGDTRVCRKLLFNE